MDRKHLVQQNLFFSLLWPLGSSGKIGGPTLETSYVRIFLGSLCLSKPGSPTVGAQRRGRAGLWVRRLDSGLGPRHLLSWGTSTS